MRVSYVVQAPVVTHGPDGWRVASDVDGAGIWLASRDIRLRGNGESMASALLIPAVAAGTPFEVEAPVCPTWYANLPEVFERLRAWWGYTPVWPVCHTGPRISPPDGRRLTALCFSGGVDSFFSLLRGPRPPDVLVAVHGFDIPLADQVRMDAFARSLRGVAEAVGARAAVVRTNLREHPRFARTSWERTHGGALAAVGHALSAEVGTLLISASYAYHDSHPWGTHFELDHLWGSSSLTIEHVGATHMRTEKLREIAGEAVVRDHLRVCWENLAPDLNCSRCEKCVRTQLVLQTCGQLERYSVFRHDLPLADRVDRIETLRIPSLAIVYGKLLELGLPRDTDRAVRRLLRRTRAAALRARGTDALRRVNRVVARVLRRASEPEGAAT
jgi:hypothetical protein